MISIRYFKLAVLAAGFIGIFCASFFYLSFLNGKISPVVRFFDFWLPSLVMVFMLIYIRSFRAANEPFHFWEGLILGNMMFWIGGLFSGILIWLVSSVDGTPFQNFILSSIDYLQLDQKNTDESLRIKNLDLVIKEMRETVPSFMIWDEVKKKVMYSFVLVPLISMILRRK